MNLTKHLINEYPDEGLLYHYTKASTFLDKITQSNTLKFSSFKDTNDPVEFVSLRHYVMGSGNKDELDSLFTKGREISNIRNNIKVCCFSIDYVEDQYSDTEKNFCRGFCRCRMWSQYAENHSGLCLVFNKERIKNRFLSSINSENTIHIKKYESKVKYDNNLSGLFNLTNLKNVPLEKNAFEFINDNIDIYAFTKLKDYRDEQEYRLVVVPETLYKFELSYMDSLVGIIAGYRFPEIYKVSIEKYAKENNCFLFYMSWTNGKPSLTEKLII